MEGIDVLNGFKVQVAAHLAGSKKAVEMGGTIFVSPAMYDLLSHADEVELRRLLEAIEMVRIPMPSLSLSVFATPNDIFFGVADNSPATPDEIRAAARRSSYRTTPNVLVDNCDCCGEEFTEANPFDGGLWVKGLHVLLCSKCSNAGD